MTAAMHCVDPTQSPAHSEASWIDQAEVTITRWPSLLEPRGKRAALAWRALANELATPAPRPDDPEHPRLAGWAPAIFADDRRAKAQVTSVSALVLDLDSGSADLERVRAAFDGARVIVHSTRRYTVQVPRWRVVVAVSRPMTAEQHAIVWESERKRLATLGISLDGQTKDPSRFWFAPCEPLEGTYVFASLEGEPLDVDDVIERDAMTFELPMAPQSAARVSAPATAPTLPPPPAAVEATELAAIAMSTRARRASGWIATAAPSVSGARGHDDAMRVASAVVRGFALGDSAEARDVLGPWNDRCDPPWSYAELDHKISEAMRVGRHAWGCKLPNAAKPETSAPVTASAWAERVTPCADAWFTDAPTKRDWLLRDNRTDNVDGVLPRGKVGLLIAEGGAGKTMALVELATAVATASPWLGAFAVPAAGRVLAVLGEEDADEVRRRCFNAARATRARRPEPGSIVVLPLAGLPCAMIEADDRGNAVDAPFLRWLRSEIASLGPFALIVVDPFSRFAGADAEVDNAAATRFIQALESLATDTGATVIVAHHVNKTARGNGAPVTGASSRGSSAIFDGVRWAAALSAERLACSDPDTAARLSEIVTLTVVKSNYSRKGDPVLLRRDFENGGALLPLDDADLETVRASRAGTDPGARRQAARDERGKARTSTVATTVLDLLRQNPEGLSYRALRGHVHAALGTCSDPTLNAAIRSLGDTVSTFAGTRNSTIHCLTENSR